MNARPMTAVLVATLAGCSSYSVATMAPPRAAVDPPPADLAKVCVLRPHSMAGLVTVVVRDNDRLVGATHGPTYFCYLAAPGKHRITAVGGDDVDEALGTSNIDKAELDAVAGRAYYLHESVGNLYGVSALEWVDERAARKMADECQYGALDRVPTSEELPAPIVVAPAAPRRRATLNPPG